MPGTTGRPPAADALCQNHESGQKILNAADEFALRLGVQLESLASPVAGWNLNLGSCDHDITVLPVVVISDPCIIVV